MKDIDHKLSREIVNTAKAHDVSVIKLERLQNIRSTTRTRSKKQIITCIHGRSIDSYIYRIQSKTGRHRS